MKLFWQDFTLFNELLLFFSAELSFHKDYSFTGVSIFDFLLPRPDSYNLSVIALIYVVVAFGRRFIWVLLSRDMPKLLPSLKINSSLEFWLPI